MIKSSVAVKAKIKNRAGGNSDKSQIMLRIYLMERLLERVSVSEYRDNFILKGGLLVSSLVGVDMRSTMDIDTTVKSIPLNKESAKNILQEIMSIDLEDGVSFQITRIQDIMEGHAYEGVRFMIDCTFDKIRQTIKVDISTGDVITPRQVQYKLPLIIEDRTIDIWTYNLETLLAEKLETIMTRAQANTRMRDFYDIYVLYKQVAYSINKEILNAAFLGTCKKRESVDQILRLDSILNSINGSKVMEQQWENYRKTNYYVGELGWNEVMESVIELKEMVDLNIIHGLLINDNKL